MTTVQVCRYTPRLATAGPVILEVYVIPDEASLRNPYLPLGGAILSCPSLSNDGKCRGSFKTDKTNYCETLAKRDIYRFG